MAIKTITVTVDAYEAIKSLKRTDESFSELFRRLRGKQLKVKDILGVLKYTPEQGEEFARRVHEIHEQLGEGLRKRIEDVRTRLKRTG